jgi:hypothetical protein
MTQFLSSSIDKTGTPITEALLYSSNPFVIEALDGTDATPIPPTIWLFSAGLLGFLGLKRKYLS